MRTRTRKGYTIIGKELDYIKLTLKAGRKYFSKLGFAECLNPNWMERKGYYVHFNSHSKVWILG